MSRCFPFPPPGYEKKPRSGEHGDLLAKEKHKEKKHKKEKDKERKNEDKSKDKHKEKKDRKEKHRDKKKDKDRDKERNKISEDQRTEIHHEDKLGYDSCKADEFRDSKFTEELGRRIRHEEQGATSRMAEDTSAIHNKRIESTGTSTAMVNKMSTNVPVTIRRNEKLTPSFHKRTEVMEISTSTEKQKATSSEKVHDNSSTERRRNKYLIPQVQKRTETMGNAAAMEKQRAANNHKVGDFTNLVERTEGMLTVNSIQRAAMEKQRAANNHKVGDFTNLVGRTEGMFTVNSIQRAIEPRLTPSFHKRTEVKEISTSTDKQKATSSEEVHDVTSTERRRNEYLIPQVQERTETICNAAAMEKQRAASTHKVGDFTNLVERTEGMLTVNSIQREMVTGNNLVSNTIGSSTKRNDQAKENLTSIPRKIESVGAAPATEKGRFVFPNVVSTEQRKAEQMELQIQKGTDKKAHGKEKSKEKKSEDDKREGHKDSERKEKKRKEKDKNREKDKDKNRDKEKKKDEKKREKREHKRSKRDKLKENEIKDRIPNLNPTTLAPRVENINAVGADGPNKTREFEGNPNESDGSNKKRKEFEMNGFLHEPQHDGRPSKIPRTSVASFHPPAENGRPTKFASGCSPIKLGGINNTKSGRGLDNNGKHINGKVEVQPSPLRKPHIPPVVDSSIKVAVQPSPRLKPPIPPVVDSTVKAAVLPSPVTKPPIPPVAVQPSPVLKPPPITPVVDSSLKVRKPPVPPVVQPSRPPHPDTKYLGTVYTVPKMEELSKSEDLDWLFNDKKPPSTTMIEADGTPPQVGAKGLQIESADVFALPYVIPF